MKVSQFLESEQVMELKLEETCTYECRYQQWRVWQMYCSNVEDKVAHGLFTKALMQHMGKKRRGGQDDKR